jgi:hypothetical protein
MAEQQTCPRRAENPGPWRYDDGPDTWDKRGGPARQNQVGPSCSYCGSLHPDRFMELVRNGWIVGPTDKNYKAYLAKPYTDDEKATRKQRWTDTDAMAVAVRDLGQRDGKTAEQINADIEHLWNETQGPTASEGVQVAKFYYQHLSEAQRNEFVDLVNAGRMVFGYPGYLYRLPFFCRRSENAAT